MKFVKRIVDVLFEENYVEDFLFVKSFGCNVGDIQPGILKSRYLGVSKNGENPKMDGL